MRYPIKFVILALFALPMLAAYAVSSLLAIPTGSAGAARANRGLLIEVGFCSPNWAIVAVAGRFPKDWENWSMVWHNGALRAVFLILSMGILVALRRVTEFKQQVLCGVGLLVILWADVYTHAPKINPTVDRLFMNRG